MTSGFQQQSPNRGLFTRSAPEPQHGKKADETALAQKPQRPSRTFEPRPGH